MCANVFQRFDVWLLSEIFFGWNQFHPCGTIDMYVRYNTTRQFIQRVRQKKIYYRFSIHSSDRRTHTHICPNRWTHQCTCKKKLFIHNTWPSIYNNRTGKKLSATNLLAQRCFSKKKIKNWKKRPIHSHTCLMLPIHFSAEQKKLFCLFHSDLFRYYVLFSFFFFFKTFFVFLFHLYFPFELFHWIPSESFVYFECYAACGVACVQRACVCVCGQ